MTRNLRTIGKLVPSSLLLSTALAACTVAPFHNVADASTTQAHPASPLDR
jgi:hypothetical protein